MYYEYVLGLRLGLIAKRL